MQQKQKNILIAQENEPSYFIISKNGWLQNKQIKHVENGYILFATYLYTMNDRDTVFSTQPCENKSQRNKPL